MNQDNDFLKKCTILTQKRERIAVLEECKRLVCMSSDLYDENDQYFYQQLNNIDTELNNIRNYLKQLF